MAAQRLDNRGVLGEELECSGTISVLKDYPAMLPSLSPLSETIPAGCGAWDKAACVGPPSPSHGTLMPESESPGRPDMVGGVAARTGWNRQRATQPVGWVGELNCSCGLSTWLCGILQSTGPGVIALGTALHLVQVWCANRCHFKQSRG